MPITKVRTPDGEVISVEHPEGAGEADIIAYAKKNYQPTPYEQKVEPTFMEALQAGDVPEMAAKVPALAGVGQAVKEMGRNLANNLPFIPDQQPSPSEAQAWNQFAQENPSAEIGRFVGRTAPSMVFPGSLLGQIGAIAGPAMLEENPITSALWGAGGAAVGALPSATGKIFNAFRGRFPEREIADAVPGAQILRDFQSRGGRVAPGEAGDAAQFLDKMTASNILTERVPKAMKDLNDNIARQSIAKAMGTQVTEFTDEGLRTIRKELEGKYDNIFSQVTAQGGIGLDPAMEDAARKVLGNGYFEKHFAQAAQTGYLSGPEFRSLRTELSKATTVGKPKVRRAAMDAVSDLDAVLARHVPMPLKDEYDTVREQWRNYFAVKDIRSPKSRTASGDIEPNVLLGRLRKAYDKSGARNPETKEMVANLDAISTILGGGGYRGLGIGEEVRTQYDVLNQIFSAPFAGVGAARYGAPELGGVATGANLGRILLSPELREKSGLSPSDNYNILMGQK